MDAAATRSPWDVPTLASRPGGFAERAARTLGGRHPVLIFFTCLIAGLAALALVSILLGLLLVHVLAGAAGLDGADNSVVEALADHRTGSLTNVSSIASDAGGGVVLPLLVGAVGLAGAIARRWRIAAFAIFVLLTESAAYRITTYFIHRDRPSVPRLEGLPGNASYPSGHTAASVAVYLGLVMLLTSRFTDAKFRVVAWTLGILMVSLVALSRMYRGMHHPLDLAGGVIVGLGAILVVRFACRAAYTAK